MQNNLTEASYLCTNGEIILEEARDFTKKGLKEILKQVIDPNLALLVSHSLELPLHWRLQRLEARWFVDVYEKIPYLNPTVLKLEKLDYNMV